MKNCAHSKNDKQHIVAYTLVHEYAMTISTLLVDIKLLVFHQVVPNLYFQYPKSVHLKASNLKIFSRCIQFFFNSFISSSGDMVPKRFHSLPAQPLLQTETVSQSIAWIRDSLGSPRVINSLVYPGFARLQHGGGRERGFKRIRGGPPNSTASATTGHCSTQWQPHGLRRPCPRQSGSGAQRWFRGHLGRAKRPGAATVCQTHGQATTVVPREAPQGYVCITLQAVILWTPNMMASHSFLITGALLGYIKLMWRNCNTSINWSFSTAPSHTC